MQNKAFQQELGDGHGPCFRKPRARAPIPLGAGVRRQRGTKSQLDEFKVGGIIVRNGCILVVEVKMPTITLKSIPPFLHVELKKRAEINKRSLNNEILVCLESFLGFRIFEKNQYLEEVREFRKTIKYKITQKMINDLKNKGRK